MRSRRFTVTFFEQPNFESFDKKKFRYWISQEEFAPTTGTIHYQSYFETVNAHTCPAMKKLLLDNTAHVLISKGSEDKNTVYCSKPDTQLSGPVVWGTPCQPGERNDLRDLIDAAAYMPANRIVDEYGGNALRHINFIKSYQRSRFQPDSLDKLMEEKYKRRLLEKEQLKEFSADRKYTCQENEELRGLPEDMLDAFRAIMVADVDP